MDIEQHRLLHALIISQEGNNNCVLSRFHNNLSYTITKHPDGNHFAITYEGVSQHEGDYFVHPSL
jgi:hypothetical protein